MGLFTITETIFLDLNLHVAAFSGFRSRQFETVIQSEQTTHRQEVVMTGTKTKQVVIHIDQQKFELEERPYTAHELLVLAGENPTETTLVLKHGHELTKFEDPTEPIELKNGMQFVVFHNGPTPVS
jgi:hypothetical protein